MWPTFEFLRPYHSPGHKLQTVATLILLKDRVCFDKIVPMARSASRCTATMTSGEDLSNYATYYTITVGVSNMIM